MILVLVVLTLAGSLSGPPRTSAATCLDVDVSQLTLDVQEAEVILIARVERIESERSVELHPEAYLKGPARGGTLTLAFPDPRPRCPLAAFEPGSRLVAFLDEGPKGLEWPGAWDVFFLRDGQATGGFPPATTLPEDRLIGQIRTLTGQFAVPAETPDEGAAIDWVGTVLPVGAVIAGLMVIGLLLMRIWHRIDPS